jgi:hypothetical protein
MPAEESASDLERLSGALAGSAEKSPREGV